ncbi:hypothetical protein Plec18167_000594 [Paecilomyces lecythidis]|uniref:Uncharacterized protein n=1 Tax=Paecilomyces lecythidis TaxID=3004212 RepID=A0ABR3YFB2_9EURO
MPSHPLKAGSHHKKGYIEDEVDDIVHDYGRVRKPHPVLKEPLERPDSYALLWEVIENQITLIKSRSQAFEDGHITIYDKALLILTKNGKEIMNLGALELFLEEYVGIPAKGSIAKQQQVLDKHVALKSLLKKISQSDKNMDEKAGIDTPIGDSSSPLQDSQSHEREIKHGSAEGPVDPKVDEGIVRMLDTYIKAKEDYHATSGASRFEKLDAVKFLRDTAENTLNYLQVHGLADHAFVPELQRSFEMAKDVATSLSNGRKRRFEIHEGRGYSGGRGRHGNKYPRGRSGDFYRP